MTRSIARLELHEDRYFDSDPAIRRAAREIYERTRALPLICPHGHVDPRLLAEDAPFPDPTALLVTPDHYILRMLYSKGIPLEQLGIPTSDDAPANAILARSGTRSRRTRTSFEERRPARGSITCSTMSSEFVLG
jgi:glucuronate isomerase